MDGDRRAPAAAAASVAAVFGAGDLLREILLRLTFPHYLVRAALVSKQWLLHASDPTFLRRFRDRHPPSLLGFCAGYPRTAYQFVQLPQPPELAALSRRAASSCNEEFATRGSQWIKHCRNGRLLIERPHHGRGEYSLLAPLLAGEPIAVLPPASLFCTIFLPEDGCCDGITMVSFHDEGREVRAKVSVLGSGQWGVQATAAIQLEPPYPAACFQRVLPPVHGMIFVVTNCGYTLVLDLATPRFFILELPDGVERDGAPSNFMLSCAENSGLYLVNAEEFQISVWLHRMNGDGYGAGGWLLVDTFCVREACARLGSWVPQHGGFVKVVAVGDNADFVFLDHIASGAVFYVHLRSKEVQKVYQRVPDRYFVRDVGIDIFPIMMTWPPIFPARDVGLDQQ
ncbi:uncharacterized protein LOC124680848 [Lolium rigidum]|uniref:uncharacterized protein LOC124680848 n=1 Tax=Lolium rigidum TaxID=89674 RepID=UPI001F5D6000|nr:uncharacterized protein LOC124680848 [Lolium rigidum]